MAPHDQHSVVTGLDGVGTNIPLVLPFVSSVRAISRLHFSPDKPPLSEFRSNRTSSNYAAPGVDFGSAEVYENELPQPQDFFAFGFRNSKPWCIRLSS